MSTAGPNLPGTAADDSSVGTRAWGTPNNALANDSTATSATSLTGAVVSHYLVVTNFGFSIPAGATINGIQVDVSRRSNSTGMAAKDNRVRIVQGGAIGTTDKSSATNWVSSSSFRLDSFGGAADLWGLSWASTDINNSGFGFAVSAKGAGGKGSASAFIDYVQITVTYTGGGGGTTTNWYYDRLMRDCMMKAGSPIRLLDALQQRLAELIKGRWSHSIAREIRWLDREIESVSRRTLSQSSTGKLHC